MQNWFPIFRNMLEENEQFKQLTPVEKLLYFLLISEFNARSEFYKADLEAAVTLSISEIKARQARRKFQKFGWIKTRPGFRAKGRNLATRYFTVKWAVLVKGDFFAQMHRYAFEAMLAKIRCKTFVHADVVVYIYLCYLFWKNRGKNGGIFYITKARLRELTGIRDAPARVERLRQNFVFAGDHPLFDYHDQYHRLLFTEWNTFADPADDEQNKKLLDSYLQEIKDAVQRAKATKKEEEEKEESGK